MALSIFTQPPLQGEAVAQARQVGPSKDAQSNGTAAHPTPTACGGRPSPCRRG
jgi:hypothetical protein